MTISLSDAGKRFNREWIFRHFTYNLESGNSYAVTGPNGSGKSTLLQVLSGSMMMNEGKIQYAPKKSHGTAGSSQPLGRRRLAAGEAAAFPAEDIYKHVSLCAPYLELVEEMTVKEFLHFHTGFKPLLKGVSVSSIITTIGLEKAADKQIRYYSSGMKQRVKLAQCIFSDTAIVLLDEPCTNLDTEGIALYHQLIASHTKNRLVVVSSNDEIEYNFCNHHIRILDYK